MNKKILKKKWKTKNKDFVFIKIEKKYQSYY